MAVPDLADSLVGIHPDMIAATRRIAERQADLTSAALRIIVEEAIRRGEDFDCQQLSASFLLELSALAHLRAWEQSGLSSLLNDDLPTYEAAEAALRVRV
ncbi:MAG: hypothetical protein K8U03_25485 [Planctomycetia bacterium]|nr:hypothetical protein [Planctomycetia bacterium]